jgi:hypothetical protein
MIKASVLLYSVTISIFILITTLFVVTSMFDAQISAIEFTRCERVSDNINSAIELILSGGYNSKKGIEEKVDLFGDGKDFVFVTRMTWGIMEVFQVQSAVGKCKAKRCFFVGQQHDSTVALSIKDNDRIFSIAGSSQIVGKAYLPSGTYKRVVIDGRPTNNSNPVTGSIFHSQEYTEFLDKDRAFEIAKKLFSAAFENTLTYDKIEDGKYCSFFDTARLLFSRDIVKLSNSRLRGHIIVRSLKGVVIENTCNLEDVIVIAPRVVVGKKFEGNLQIFASQEIVIEEGAYLRYPSTVTLIQDKMYNASCRLSIEPRAVVKGHIFILKPKEYPSLPTGEFGEESVVEGSVICDGVLQHKGIIKGTLSTRNLTAKTSSSLYDNTLYNGNISAVLRNHNCFDLLTDSKDKAKKIVKWAY